MLSDFSDPKLPSSEQQILEVHCRIPPSSAGPVELRGGGAMTPPPQVPTALIRIYPRCERSWSLIALRSPRNTRFEDVVSILNATLKLEVSSTLSNKVVRLALSKALSLYLVKPSNKY